MKLSRHLRLPLLGGVAALALVGLVYGAVEYFTRDPPNYSRIEDGLFMGGFVPDPPRGTRAVLNLCEMEDPYTAEVHRWEPIPDGEPAPDLAWLRRMVEFIEENRAAGRTTFVHCRNGVSRSGLVVVAYLMHKNKWSRDESLAFVRTRREIVRPNPAFLQLLAEWERALAR